jgi:hypothetical protein
MTANLGSATLLGKVTLVSQTSQGLDALNTFVLFGDPAQNIRLDQPLFLPTIRR